jgi:hypothetical protein
LRQPKKRRKKTRVGKLGPFSGAAPTKPAPHPSEDRAFIVAAPADFFNPKKT